ncbi:calcium-independent phospholipase A2-gamma-like isoform X1 [Trichogramma pretiosum]|uniref:calcium-independent phospholipase A2-gamma-like isoform X1 n=1 Tax=Trichogramma pretiosum TaxID=7493 RepID=UPI0006C9A261|nr:calcium-independent phospholipase A2-gamma-like isoform X1 [Trichogramma pretiosum]
MSVQNKVKLLSQLKNLLNKFLRDKNYKIITNKDYIEFFQNLSYAQNEFGKKYLNFYENQDSSSVKVSIKNNESIRDEIKPKNILICDKKDDQPKTGMLTPQTGTSSELKDAYYYLPQIITDLIKPKISSINKQPLPSTMPKWKTSVQNKITKNSILSRTRHILNSIVTAESNSSKWRRIEDLLYHLEQFPEARHYAVKSGAVRILLKSQNLTKDQQIKATIKEALAVLGHVDFLPARGIRILAIDGGGIRGVLVIEMLKKLEQLTGKKVHEMFDYICGVSTGAILSAVLAAMVEDTKQGGHKRKSLDEISELYKELSTRIFTQSTFKGTSGLVYRQAYYDTALWEQMLQEQLGTRDLIKTTRDPIAPKFSVVSAVVNHERVMAYVFRNYAIPIGVESQYLGSYKHKLWEAVRASAAAPIYFEEFKCGGFLHQDGGIMVNNPCAVAIHEAKQLWPNSPIQCVLSFGTGRTPLNINNFSDDKIETAASSWKDKFYKILDSATDTEAVHIMLNDLLPDHAYFRFNPYLTEMVTMVEIRPDKISQLEQDARMYIRRNEEKFRQAAKVLTQKKKLSQKVKDWIKWKKTTLGI